MLDEVYQEQIILIGVVVVYGRNTPEAADSKRGEGGGGNACILLTWLV